MDTMDYMDEMDNVDGVDQNINDKDCLYWLFRGDIQETQNFFDTSADNVYYNLRFVKLNRFGKSPETQVNTVVTALRSGKYTGLAGQKLGVFDSSGSARPIKTQPSE